VSRKPLGLKKEVPLIIKVKNKLRAIKPLLIGDKYPTRIVTNVGLSPQISSFKYECKKAKYVEKYGASIIADHTITSEKDITSYLKYLINNINLPVSTVPLYQIAIRSQEKHGAIVNFCKEDIMEVILQQAELGVDIMTFHASIIKTLVEKLPGIKRNILMSSRGGTLITAYMIHNNCENPFYEYFEEILEILQKYNITLSLGPSLRTGSITDNLDSIIHEEIEIHSQLVKLAIEKGVNVMVEYGGHIRLDLIPNFIKDLKGKVFNVPIRSLIICTDISAGWDHISASIASTTAALNGADLLVVITRAEHLGLPRIKDIIEGIVTFKIAAHIADSVSKKNISADMAISIARKNRNWSEVLRNTIDSDYAKSLFEILKSDDSNNFCSMCGPLCAHKIVEEYINN